jgi:CHAT domain-containing protein
LKAAGSGRRLIQDLALAIAPSGSIWHRLVSAPPLRTVSYLALANPRPLPDPKLPALPQAETEVDQIRRQLAPLEITVLKNTAATESAFRERVPGKSIVHLATHGAFPSQNALDFHQFLLAPSDGHDGCMRAEELRGLDFKSAGLVALSICNGGIYRFGPGDEPYGLVPALFAAGARNVLGTLWGIEDLAGRLFMVEFYSKLLALGPDEALRRAACRSIEAGWDLRRWAAFLIAGPARPSAH